MGVSFSDGAKGLKTRDWAALDYFALVDDKGPFVWAKAQVHGDKIWVSSEKVKRPTRIRYGWADNPHSANQVNGAGLPAGSFEAIVE